MLGSIPTGGFMKKFNEYILENEDFSAKLKQKNRIETIDRSIYEIEAALLGIQSDGVTNSSELIKMISEFRTRWEMEKERLKSGL